MVYDAEAVKRSVRNILTWRVGESVLHPEFGHRLQKSMYSQLTDLSRDKVCHEVQRALEENEPRIIVKGVAAKVDDSNDQDGVLLVKVAYAIKGADRTSDSQFVVEAQVGGK